MKRVYLFNQDWLIPQHPASCCCCCRHILHCPHNTDNRGFFSDTIFVQSCNYLVNLWIISSICHWENDWALTHWPNWLWGTRWRLLPGVRYIGESWLLDSIIWFEHLLRSLLLVGFNSLWISFEYSFPVLYHYGITFWKNYFFYYLVAL